MGAFKLYVLDEEHSLGQLLEDDVFFVYDRDNVRGVVFEDEEGLVNSVRSWEVRCP